MQRYHEPPIMPKMKRLEPSIHPIDAIEDAKPGLTPVSACSRVIHRPYLVEHVGLQQHIYAEHDKTFKRRSLLDSRVSRMTQVLVSINK
jgi:hypothetical protein